MLLPLECIRMFEMGEAYVLITNDQISHICGGILVKLLVISKYEDRDVYRA